MTLRDRSPRSVPEPISHLQNRVPQAPGGVRTDLQVASTVTYEATRVECRLTEVAVEAYGETSGVTLVVPDGWAVDTSGMDPGVGGLTDKTTPDRLPGTPLIRLTGSGGMAGVVIRHPNRRERRKLDSNPTQG